MRWFVWIPIIGLSVSKFDRPTKYVYLWVWWHILWYMAFMIIPFLEWNKHVG